MTYLGWLKVFFLSSGEQYASFCTPQAKCRTIIKNTYFSSNFANFDIFAIWAKFMHMSASTRTIPCSRGQYASFGTPHAYLKTKFQNLKFSKNQKRAWPFRHVYQCLKFWQFVIMITKHHIDLIQVSNSLDLKMTTGPLWGPSVVW